MSAPTSTTSNNVTLIALVFPQSGYLQRRSFECAMSIGSEASICLSDFSLKEVQFVGRKPSAEETQVLMNLSIPFVSPSRV